MVVIRDGKSVQTMLHFDEERLQCLILAGEDPRNGRSYWEAQCCKKNSVVKRAVLYKSIEVMH
ncbi:hypothetical protein LF1_24940 [Rubripirellula obstinata]|uniref:Uncharacterized protein n=1 Tax=Rubripirellula obstinata TaxID=406547 RepID=A0A5B1CHD0_9BACT|nr:hypothetical protein LF1_24940 [Rubripirellula obstinata]